MVDSRIENLAKLCVQYSINVKSKEKVLIQGNALALPLIRELYKECLLGGAYPTIIPSLDVEYIFLKYAKEHQLRFVPPFQKFLVKDVDVAIRISCEPNPRWKFPQNCTPKSRYPKPILLSHLVNGCIPHHMSIWEPTSSNFGETPIIKFLDD